MRWPVNPVHNPAKLSTFQTVMVPHAGKPFIFTRIPGASYASVGVVYTCSGYPKSDKWASGDIHLSNVATGSGCYDRISAWDYAEWEYVNGEEDADQLYRV